MVSNIYIYIILYIIYIIYIVYCLFLPLLFGEDSHFDVRIFFKWVGEKPPTRSPASLAWFVWGCQHKSGGQRMRRGHGWCFRNPGSTHQLRLVAYRLFLQGFIDPKGGWPWDFWKISTIQALRHTHEGPAIFVRTMTERSPGTAQTCKTFTVAFLNCGWFRNPKANHLLDL